MKTKQTHGKVYISLVSALLLAAPAAAFADEPDCVTLIAQAQAMNASALAEDAAFNTNAAGALNGSTYTLLETDAGAECKDLPEGDSDLVQIFLSDAQIEVFTAGRANADGNAVAATANEAYAAISLTEASAAAVLGVPVTP